MWKQFLNMEDYTVELKNMHNEAYKKLQQAASKFVDVKNNSLIFKAIGRAAGCSHITVWNYVKGEGKDGYLTEILTKAFKKYKIENN